MSYLSEELFIITEQGKVIKKHKYTTERERERERERENATLIL